MVGPALASILLVTRNGPLAAYAAQALAAAGHVVTVARSTSEAARAWLSVRVDVVIAGGPISDLHDVRSELDSLGCAVPFVIISAAGLHQLPERLQPRVGDRLVRNPLGADVLTEAIASVLSAEESPAVVNIDDLTFDRSGQRILRGDSSQQLTPTEFRLLDILASQRGSLVRTEEILAYVWDDPPDAGYAETLRSHVKNLRAKVRRLTGGPDLIETVPRRGYRLVSR